MNKTEYENLINEKLASVKEELMNEFKEEKKSEYPEYDTIYHYINSYGDVCWDRWIGSVGDKQRFAFGNYFETREEAEFKLERLKVIAELKRFAEPKDRAWNQVDEHWFLFLNTENGRIDYTSNWTFKRSNIYFASKEDAMEAVKTVGKDRVRRFYLGVEE